MSTNKEDNKRIAKNTLLLYFRMLLLMFVSLYTSRVILNSLGVEDYGIYNVVGGVIIMFSALSGSLSSAISRFITFELGKGNTSKIKRVFSCSITIQILLALIIVIIAETIGLWFLYNKLVIPQNRLDAALWCYQCSIITFVINLITVPYNAVIIAYEKMSVFAYISILEAFFKLVVAWCISLSPIDKLTFYSLIVALIAWIIRIIYSSYCKYKFKDFRFQLNFDKGLLKQMFGFAGWNFIGVSSAIFRDQGGSIILNLFYGPTVNAARAIANRVNSTVTSFIQNFTVALNPQITKSYANGNHTYMLKLIYKGAKYSYYILFLLCLPILLNTDIILGLWLKLVPEHSVIFVQLSIIFALSECISYPLITAMLATGNIKKYQIIVGSIQMLNLPISYILLKLGASPDSIFIVAIVLSQCCLISRLIMLKEMIGLDIKVFFQNVYLKGIIVTLTSTIIPYSLQHVVKDNMIGFLMVSLSALCSTIIAEMFIGCNKDERRFVYIQVQKLYKKIIRK